MDFRDHIRKNILNKNDRILEFGPLTRPLVLKKDYTNVFFADIRSTKDIKELYKSNEYLKSTGIRVDIDSIVDIDYVVTKSYKETFKNQEKFDAVILSHVVEHMPDIIYFFEDIANILKEDGKLILIYPDAKYCFDHFRNGSTFIDAYNVNKNKTPNCNSVFDFTFNVVHENNPNLFWNSLNFENQLLPENDFKKAMIAFRASCDGKMPGDVHFWPFSDYQFVKFLYDMDRASLLKFDIETFYETQENTQEFMVILSPKKKNEINFNQYKNILNDASPSIKVNILKSKIVELNAGLSKMKIENEKKSEELREIYESKKWKYANRVAQAKNKIIGN